jgi:hypothetical protein
MTDIFMSYKREDEARVAPIVEGLRRAGLTVWWDHDIAVGGVWRQAIDEHLMEARCVVVVWSAFSVSPLGSFVHDEAARAKARGVLLPLRIDAVTEPLGFGEIQSLDLVDWKGNDRDWRFQNIVTATQAIAAGRPRPVPTTRSKRARRLAALLSGFGMAATGLSFVMNLAGLQKPLCQVPGIHALCAKGGLGGVATKDEDALWATRKPGDCEVLRTYLGRFSDGAFSTEASRLLLEAKPVKEERWGPPEEHRLPLQVRATIDPLPSEQAARDDAMARGTAQATDTCAEYKVGDNYRLLAATVEAAKPQCSRRGAGFVCGFEGHQVCRIQILYHLQRQTCG